MAKVAIIDYGVGNLRSVEKAFLATGSEAIVTSDLHQIITAERLVLPGVGAFAACMDALRTAGFDSVVRQRAADGTPLLGVCVGMQMLFDESEEFGHAQGLGLLAGSVKRFPNDLRIPQVGWNQVEQVRQHPMLNNDGPAPFFYFVHSFFCDAADASVVVGITEYGIRYPSVVAKGNVCGVQFHPEKSQAAGLRLLRNFATMPTAVDSRGQSL